MKRIITILIFLFSCSFIMGQAANNSFKSGEGKFSAGNYKGALTDYSKAIRLDSTKVNYFIRRGFCFSMLKDYDSAIEDYTTVIRMEGKNKWAYLSRGSAQNKIGAYVNAIKDFDEVLRLDSSDDEKAEAYNNRGFAKKMLGNMKGACDDWNKSRKMGNEEAKIILENNHCD